MPQPQTSPSIRKGDRVIIKPEWRDAGDELLIWMAVEDEDGGRVLISPLNTGLTFPPQQVVTTEMLETPGVSFKLVIDAYACDELGNGPAYAVITVDQGFIDQLNQLLELCKTHKLESATVSLGPDFWDNEVALQIGCDELVITSDGQFWFKARLDNADYTVETKGMDIESLQEIAELGPDTSSENDHFRWSKGVLYSSNDPGLINDLIDMVKEDA